MTKYWIAISNKNHTNQVHQNEQLKHPTQTNHSLLVCFTLTKNEPSVMISRHGVYSQWSKIYILMKFINITMKIVGSVVCSLLRSATGGHRRLVPNGSMPILAMAENFPQVLRGHTVRVQGSGQKALCFYDCCVNIGKTCTTTTLAQPQCVWDLDKYTLEHSQYRNREGETQKI